MSILPTSSSEHNQLVALGNPNYLTTNFLVNRLYSSKAPRLDKSQVLDEARQLIEGASSLRREGWKTVSFRRGNYNVSLGPNLFEYTRQLPRIDLNGRIWLGLGEIKSWDASDLGIEDSMIYHLEDLDEFECVPASLLASVPCMVSPSPRPTKPTAQLRLYTGPLGHIIPEPHIQPTQYTASSADISTLPPYDRVPPFLIPDAPEERIPHGRGAWIVPIRGRTRWKDASGAVVLPPEGGGYSQGGHPDEDMAHVFSQTMGERESRVIVWTWPSIASFWTYLLTLHQTTLRGHIGLSFHLTHPHPHLNSTGNPESQPFQPSLFPSPPTMLTIEHTILVEDIAVSELSTHPVLEKKVLRAVDHIKVYHDLDCSGVVRWAIDQWRCEEGTMNSPLDRARLVLMDQLNRGLLVS